ncbi:unnamed protein product [Lactuca virosa]|uniref:Leucine-rich repeat-containing N-terminal plant-type domain-containing protein n=1 Tax=Lactuca virosa TaxID=75947 RepID=A0AAU9LJ65_9ASTR|nr:unnamed protein product [Lactuca virosa]
MIFQDEVTHKPPDVSVVWFGGCDTVLGQISPANELTGSIPPEIGNLTNLQQLYLGYYKGHTGGIPPKIGNLSSLIRLNAANCGLSGEVPPKIGKLQNLDTLW